MPICSAKVSSIRLISDPEFIRVASVWVSPFKSRRTWHKSSLTGEGAIAGLTSVGEIRSSTHTHQARTLCPDLM